MRLFLFAILVTASCFNTILQAQETLQCGHDELRYSRYFRWRSDSLELAYQRSIHQRAESAPPPYVLPVVFHVIHQGGPEQLDIATIQTSLDMMNESFANINYYDQGTGVNTQIQFCLAQRTPDNQPTNGITYHNSPLTDITSGNDLDMKNLARWDPTSYVNIYVVRSICTSSCAVAGYAYLPGAHGSAVDGIVVEARWLGQNEANNALMPHEMGHYLGLYHTFQGGCINTDCTVNGDRVCDTPPDQSTAAVPCAGSANSCDTDTDSGFATDQNDMFNNYMDYGYWSCYNAFTQGQTDRMYFFIEGIRSSLLESLGCQTPCPAPVVTDFDHSFGPSNDLEAGQTVTFTNQSINADNYEWYVNGVLISTANDFSYTFFNEGFYTVRLVAYSNDGLCLQMNYQESFTVTCSLSADFTATPSAITLGNTINFMATDPSGSTYQWTFNGTVVANTANYDHLFDQAGIFEVCLTVSRDSCEREICSFFFVNPPDTGSDNCFGETFFSIYAQNLADVTQAGPIELSQAGTIWQSAILDNTVLLQELDGAGNILHSQQIFTPVPVNINKITALRELSDGSLLVTGIQGSTFNNVGNFFFRYLPTTSTIEYFKSFNHTCQIYNAIPTNGVTEQYLLLLNVSPVSTSTASNEIWVLDLDPMTGTVGINWNYQTNQLGAHTLYHGYFSGNSFYGIGEIGTDGMLSGIRAAIAQFDAPNVLSNLNLMHQPTTVPARLIGQQIIPGNTGSGGQYSIHNGNATGTITSSNYYSYFSRWLQNELFWTRELRIQNSARTIIYEIKEQAGVFYAYGSFTLDQERPQKFLAAMDGNGDVIWANTYEIDGLMSGLAQASPDGFMIVTNSHLFAPSTLLDNSFNGQAIGLLKIRLDGTVEDSCVNQIPLVLTSNTVEPFQGFYQIAATDRSPDDFFSSVGSEQILAPRYTACQDSCPTAGDDCRLTGDVFAQVLESEGLNGELQGHVMSPDGQGGLILAGSSEEQIFLHRLDQTGEANGTYLIDVPTSGGRANVITIESTNSGKILFGGIMPPRPGMSRTGFFACFDLTTNSLDWWRELDDDGEVKGMHQIGGTNEFVLTGSNLFQGSSNNSTILVQRRNISDGALNGNLYREFDNTNRDDQVLNSQLQGNTIQLTTRYTGSLGLSQMRAGYTEIDLNTGNEAKSMRAGPSLNNSSRTYCTSVVVNANGIYLLYRGDLNGIGTTSASRIYLAHLSTSGQWIWGRDYNINDFNGEYGLSLNELEDDLIITGNGYGPIDVFAMRVNQSNGNVIWANGVSNNSGNNLSFNLRGDDNTQVLGQSIFLLASQQIAPSEQRPEIIVLDAQGNGPATSCLNIYPLDITIDDLPIWEEIGLEPSNTPLGDILDAPGENNVTFTPLTPCLDSCDVINEEICDNGIDDDGNGFIDCDDPVLAQTCCCLTGPTVNLPNDTLLCPEWPFPINAMASSADLIFDWGNGILIDTLFAFDYGTYSVTVTDSCGRMASDTITISPRPLPSPPDLGPDLLVCDNGVLNLDAGPGFATYLWSDFSVDQTATFFDPGTYWLRVTDSCGNVYSDTISMSVISATSLDLTDSIQLCQGDTTSLSVSGFTTYEWYPRNVLNCNDCPLVQIGAPALGDTIIYTLVVSDGNGCFSTDSVYVFSAPDQGTNEVAEICSGDEYIFNGDTLISAGTYTSPSFCSGTDTLTLIVNQAPPPNQRFDTICSGDSILFLGQFYADPGQYADTATAINGCDSVQILNLTVLTPPTSTTDLRICSGDSILIFGTFESVAGTYSQTFSVADHPCDSMATVNLIVLDPPSPTISIDANCQNPTASVSIGNLVDSDIIIWNQPGITGLEVEIPSGTYEFSVTNADGCINTSSFEVQIPDAVEVELLSIDPSCPEGDDGSIQLVPPNTESIMFLGSDSLGIVDSIVGLSAGNYEITIIDSVNCEQNFTISLIDPAGFFVTLPQDTILRLGDILRIQSRLLNLDPLLANYCWSPTDFLNCDTCSIVNTQPQANITYLLTVTDTLGCEASDDISIILDKQERVYVPSGFTPNGDGVNDVFLPFFGPEVEAIELMQIHERWGGMVYERENFPPNDQAYGWDGTNNGQLLDPNVFVYHLRFRLIDGRVLSVAGDLTLLR